MIERQAPSRAIARKLVPWAGLSIVLAAVLIGNFAIRVFDEAVEPELNRRTQLIGSTVRSNIQLALDSGIPIGAITGADRYLVEVLGAFGEVSSLVLLAESGKIIAQARRSGDATVATTPPGGDALDARGFDLERVVIPVLDGNLRVGRIEIGIDRKFITTQFRNIFLDIAVVIIVATLLSFEILFALLSRSFAKPLDSLLALLRGQASGRFDRVLDHGTTDTLIERLSARFSDHASDLHARYARIRERFVARAADPAALDATAARLGLDAGGAERIRLREIGDIRLPFFLFVLAEELSKPFLPLYVRQRTDPGSWIDVELLIGLPLLTYLAGIALLSPFARALTLRFGARRLFLLALAPIACAHVGMALSSTVWEIAAWRAVTGAAYAVACVAFQDYALAATGGGHPGRAVGGFISVLIGGTFCGTALGGILADRLGQSQVFLAGAMLILVAGTLGLRLLERDDTTRADPTPFNLGHNLMRLFQNRRIAALVLGISIPANALAVSLLWFLVPLLAGNLGISVADTGRIMMLYYLAIILIGPLVANHATTGATAAWLPWVGAMLSGVAVLAIAGETQPLQLLLAILAVGIGHACLRTPLAARCMQIADTAFEPGAGQALIGPLQLAERIGSMLGLISVALLVSHRGYAEALMVTGSVTVLGAMAYAAVEAARRLSTRRSA